jgi:hypothetical protein
MTRERGPDQVEEVFRNVLEDDERSFDDDRPESTPPTLDPSRSDVDRNAAGGGWSGATEQVENDYETERSRIRRAEGADGERDPDEGEPHERLRM